MNWLSLGLSATALAFATTASADPCKAIPDKGPLPVHLFPGATFSGAVTYVGDGDSLCVAGGISPTEWIEVRLADFYAPELRAPGGEAAKRALSKIALGQRASCIAQRRSYDRIIATCTINGREIGDLMRRAGVAEGGRGR